MHPTYLSRTGILVMGMLFGFFGISACSAIIAEPGGNGLAATRLNLQIDAEDPASLAGVMNDLSERRVILVGETHDRFDHHLNQLAVIRHLHERGDDFAIGMEFFQRPFQPVLDAYVRGEIDEKTMLRETEYFQRWRYDYRLYRPIIEFAQRHAIPLLALNAPSELVKEVSGKGFYGVSPEWRGELPKVALAPDSSYTRRLRAVFDRHPGHDQRRFERFVQVQLLWDEYMAESAARYLERHPQRKLVVLAGSGHLRYGSGIPDRLARRADLNPVVVLNGDGEDSAAPGAADVTLLTNSKPLPPAGRLGWRLRQDEAGLYVSRGRHPVNGDFGAPRIIRVAGESIRTIEDLRLAMLDRSPGEQVWVELEHRAGEGGRPNRVNTMVKLI